MYSVKRMKRQPTDWEKILGNCIYDKGLLTRICKGLSNLNNKKTTIPIFRKWAKKLKRNFTKEKMQVGLPWWRSG